MQTNVTERGGEGGGETKIPLLGYSPLIIDWMRSNGYEIHQILNLNSTPNSIQTDTGFWEITGTETFAFMHTCDLESRSRSCRPVTNVQFSSIYHHTTLNQISSRMSEYLPTLKFSDTVSKTAVISLDSLNLALKWYQDVKLELLEHLPSSLVMSWKARKWSQQALLCAEPETPRQGQGHWQWYKMVEVNGAYEFGRCEEI